MQEFIAHLQAFSDHQLFGIAVWEYSLAGMVLVISLLINGFMHDILVHILKLALTKKDGSQNEAIVDALDKPLKLIPLACGGFLIMYILHLHGKPLDIASDVLRSILLGVFFWSAVRVLHVSDSFTRKMGLDVDITVQMWVEKSIVVLVAIFGMMVVLDVWGVPIAPILGSLGVLGIGVGMAAKDLFSNLISGVLIMGEKRFVPGEWIEVVGVINGTVLKINFRSTLVKLFDSSPVYVPNSLLANGAVINYSRMINRRISWTIGLEYTTPPQVLAKIRDDTEKWLTSNPEICTKEQVLFVRVDSFGENAINLMVYFFTKTTNWGEWLRIKDEFALALIDIVHNAGSGFAFPSRTLYFDKSIFPHDADSESEIVNPVELLQQSAARSSTPANPLGSSPPTTPPSPAQPS